MSNLYPDTTHSLVTEAPATMGKQEVAVIGTGPAGLVAAFALYNDLEGKFNVTVFEMVSMTFASSKHLELTVCLGPCPEPRRPFL